MNTEKLIENLTEYGADTQGALKRFVGDKELYGECLAKFMNDKNFNILGYSMDAKDYTAAFEAAHSLKGVSGNLGLDPLYKAICALVEELRTHKYSDLEKTYLCFCSEYMNVKVIICRNSNDT